jgi:hypothetical protein
MTKGEKISLAHKGKPKLTLRGRKQSEETKQKRLESRSKIKIKTKLNLPPVSSGEYHKAYLKQRRQNDPLYKIKHQLGCRIRETFKKSKSYKNNNTIDIIGCDLETLKQHIESQFEPWMNWNNMGKRNVIGPNTTWDIDHIIPVSHAQSEEDCIRLNHYTNLRPLCSYYNRFIKKDKI